MGVTVSRGQRNFLSSLSHLHHQKAAAVASGDCSPTPGTPPPSLSNRFQRLVPSLGKSGDSSRMLSSLGNMESESEQQSSSAIEIMDPSSPLFTLPATRACSISCLFLPDPLFLPSDVRSGASRLPRHIFLSINPLRNTEISQLVENKRGSSVPPASILHNHQALLAIVVVIIKRNCKTSNKIYNFIGWCWPKKAT
uniref:Uncharacterized protein n=1 Tax=Ditylenchus dipsaci TaxID=166011 RepID=A0A915DTW4_9BILA